MFNSILVMSASAGAGHLRAADALVKAIQAKNAAKHVEHIDALDYTNKVFRDLYSKAYLEIVNRAPKLLGWLYDHFDKPEEDYELRKAFERFNTQRLVKMVREKQPDIIVCTHFLPSEILARLKRKKELQCPLAVVVTDLDVHAMWLSRPVEKYFVAIEETKVHLEKLGVAPNEVSVTGIPIDPLFAAPLDQAVARRKLGLREKGPVILTSAGGFGVGPIEHLITSLLELSHPAQVVAICGRNADLKTKVEKLVKKHPSSKVAMHVIGFTTEMDQYMAAADLIVGKPGGLTTSEALARGLAMCIVNPIPGQEERNSDHLLEEGVAIRCNNLPTLSYKLDQLLADPPRLARMQAAAKRFSKPHAAAHIVDHLLQDFAHK